MAKLQDCQFIEIKIDGKVISGSSEEGTYKDWMEGYSSPGISIMSAPDGAYFDVVRASILMTKKSSELYEKYLKRGYKNIVISIVHRSSDKLNQSYEAQRIVYEKCKLQALNIELRDHFFMDLVFSFEESVEVIFNVPNTKDDALDKIGPIKYSVPKKDII